MLAPAFTQRTASAAIFSGEIGTCGLSAFIGTMPVMAALMINFSERLMLFDLNAGFVDFRGDAHDLHMVGQVVDDDRASGDHATGADLAAFQDGRAHADVG